MCRWQNHLQCNLKCRGYCVSMAKYFNIKKSSFGFLPSQGFNFKSLSVIREKKLVTGPRVSQNFRQTRRSYLQVRLGQWLHELYQPLLISRKFILSPLRFGRLLLGAHLSSSAWTSQGCLLPATSYLLPVHLSLSGVSSSPSKGTTIRCKTVGNVTSARASTSLWHKKQL